MDDDEEFDVEIATFPDTFLIEPQVLLMIREALDALETMKN